MLSASLSLVLILWCRFLVWISWLQFWLQVYFVILIIFNYCDKTGCIGKQVSNVTDLTWRFISYFSCIQIVFSKVIWQCITYYVETWWSFESKSVCHSLLEYVVLQWLEVDGNIPSLPSSILLVLLNFCLQISHLKIIYINCYISENSQINNGLWGLTIGLFFIV